jgi:hypothetical protein
MMHYPINAKFTEFRLFGADGLADDAVIVPTVKGTWLLRYGEHAYYFYNFKERKCLLVEIGHLHIIKPGIPIFMKALKRKDTLVSRAKILVEKFHYGFSFPEQIMLMTVPHAVTSIGDGKFLVNLWAYVGYILVDCKRRTVEYVRHDDVGDDMIYGSQQWYCHRTRDIYQMIYSLPESLGKLCDPHRDVEFRILRRNLSGDDCQEIWNGKLSDYMHDIMVNKSEKYCVACELGMFQDSDGNTIPSKVLIVDMENKRHWILSKFIVAAHAQFDPVDTDVIYFSNHNFKFIPTSIVALLRYATYSLKFNGPASVFKYGLTADGPVELGEFTDPGMFRLTNFHVFMHRGRKLLAAMGFPNLIYVADAENMCLLRKFEIRNMNQEKCFVGTISPSSDGEHLYVQTTRSFQIIDVGDGAQVYYQPSKFNHSAANHMQTAHDTA